LVAERIVTSFDRDVGRDAANLERIGIETDDMARQTTRRLDTDHALYFRCLAVLCNLSCFSCENLDSISANLAFDSRDESRFMLELVALDDDNERPAIDVNVGAVRPIRLADRFVILDFDAVDRLAKFKNAVERRNHILFLDVNFPRCAVDLDVACRTDIAFPLDTYSRTFRAPIVHDVDHDLGLMVITMRRDIRLWIAEGWSRLAAGMLAFFIVDVDESERFAVFRAMRRDIRLWIAKLRLRLAADMLAFCTRDVDHDLGFMVGAMRRDIRLWIAECWSRLAAGMLAFFIVDVDESERFAVYRAMRPCLLPFWAIRCLFPALGIVAFRTRDVDIPKLSMFRATRWFPTFRAKRCLFLLSFGFAFHAMNRHIIDQSMIIDD